METIFDGQIAMVILFYICLGISGIILNAYFAVITTPNTGNFSWKIWWKQNKNSFQLTLIGILIIVPLVKIVPEVGEIVRSVTGLDLGRTPTSHVTFGFLLYHFIRNSTKKPK